MAASLKYWRESASLIIGSRRLARMQPKQGMLGKLFGGKNSRPAQEEMEESNQEVLRFLMMKRGESASFMPSAYVFPGGVLDESDFSKDWLNLFRYNTGLELQNLFTHGKPSSPIYSRDRDAEQSHLPAEIALRVAAIRETFEESGILLARQKASLDSEELLSQNEPLQGCVADIPSKTSLEWRKKLMTDTSAFIKFCQELEVVPDIWSLYEWSNWLTPTFRKQRFDTAFFMCCVDEGPLPVDDNNEMVHAMWTSPSGMLNAYSHNMVTLSPPQLYELSRLVRFASLDDLSALAWKRAPYRSQRCMAVLMTCQDGLVFTLPGDDLYPEEPDLEGLGVKKIERKETFAELCEAYPTHHRAFLSHEYKQFQLLCNLPYVEGHILPVPTKKPTKEVEINW